MSFADEYLKLLEEDKKKKKTLTNTSYGNQYANLVNTYGLPTSRLNEVSVPKYTGLGGEKEIIRLENQNKARWFQKSAHFDDGYQRGDVAKTAGATVADVGENAVKGGANWLEKIWDGLLTIGTKMNASSMAQAAQSEMMYNTISGNGESASKTLQRYANAQEEAERATAEYVAKDIIKEENIDFGVDKYSVLGEKSDALVQSGTELLIRQGIKAIPYVGVPLAYMSTAASVMGGEAENAFKQDATFDEAVASGLVSVGAEIGTEYLFGGLKIGKSSITDGFVKKATSQIPSKFWGTLAKWGINTVGEGVEEDLSGYLSAVGQKMTYLNEKELDEIYTSEDHWDNFLGGVILGGFFEGVSIPISNKKGIDYITGLTNNEKAVVDKIYKDAVAEQEKTKGKKLTTKEKTKIFDNVIEQAEKGYISTDTIEEVLGGEDYKTYKELSDTADKLTKRMDELGKKENPNLAEQYEFSRLVKAVDESKVKRDTAKAKLDETMSGIIKNTRLVESYNEKARKGQAFEDDLTQYKDEKEKAAVERAIKSGVLNNTRRSHELVKVLSKIEADKGIIFDYTDNAKLKESGFALEGKTVNAFVDKSKGAVTLNIQSAKSWQSTVGHEISHVLEGTDAYTHLQEAVFKYAESKGELSSRRATLTDLYKNVDADIDAELTADLVGDYLFSDSGFIKNLTSNRNLFQKVYDEIKYLWNVATNKEKAEIEKVKREFDKAWKEMSVNTNAESDGKVNYSVSVEQDAKKTDTDYHIAVEKGDTETAQRMVDEAAKEFGYDLKLYHGTQDFGFTKFSTEKSIDNFTIFTSESLETVESYSKVKGIRRITDKGNGNQGNYALYGKSDNLLEIDAQGADWNHIPTPNVVTDVMWQMMGEMKTHDIAQFAKDNNYEGVKINNVVDGGTKASNVVVYFDSTSLKSADPITYDDNGKVIPLSQRFNKTNDDIRFSLSADTQGRTLSAEQQTYFKNSKIVDDNGNLKVMYHGSPETFAEFDVKKAKSSGTYGNGFYFTDSTSHANTYGKTYTVYLNITNPLQNGTSDITKEQFKKFVEAVAENEDYGIENYGYDATVESVVDSVYGKSDFGMIMDINISCVGNMVEAVKLFNKVNGTNYDGIVAPTETVAFYPNQIKNIDNLNPTDSPDIRFSLSENNSNADSSLKIGLSDDIIKNNTNYAEGENNGNQNTELLAGREVSANGGSGNSVWQQGGNSAKLAGYLENGSEFEGKIPEKCRAGESGWILQKNDTQSGQTGYNVSLLRRISRVTPSGKDTIGRKINTEISKKFASTVFKDENGNLLSLYHWTTKEFEDFAKGEFGFHFGTLDAAHDIYSNVKKTNPDTPKGNYKEVFLNITNPIELNDNLGEWEAAWVAEQLVDKGIITEHQYDLLSLTTGFYEATYDNPAAQAVRDILEQNGYDGIIYKNESEDIGSFSVIALHPEQILTVAENGTLKENSGVIDDTNDIAPINETSSKDGVFSLSNQGEQPSPVGTPLKDLYLAPTQEDIAKIEGAENATVETEDIAPMPSDEDAPPVAPMPDEIAPMTEEEANALQDEKANADAKKVSTPNTVEEEIADKRNKVETELAEKKRMRSESEKFYNAEIERLSNNPDANKDQIANLEKIKSDIDTDLEQSIKTLETRAKKMRTPQYGRAMRKKAKMQEYADFAENLLGDTSTWTDKKMGIQYEINTEHRNLRDIVRDAEGNKDIKKADEINDALNGQYNREEAAKKRELAEIRKKYANLKITKAEDAYIQMLGEFRGNPDTTLTEKVVNEYYEKHKNKIDKAKVEKIIEMARQDYDYLLNKANAALRAQGMKEIPYRQGYFPHFTEPKQNFIQKLLNWKTQDNEIPTSIAGLTEDFKPVKKYQSFDKQRHGDTTDYSFLKGFDNYSEGALDWAYHLETLQKRRAIENHIRYTHSDEGIQAKIKEVYANEDLDADEAQAQIEHILAEAKNPLNNFVQDFMTKTNILAGKKNSLDRTMEQKTNRKIYSVMTNVQNRMSANMVLANVRSALTNFIPITQSWAQVSPLRSLQATKDTIANAIKDDGLVNKSTFLTNRLREADNLYKTNWDKVLDKAGIMFEVVDNFSSQVIWRSKYNQNLAKGMSESDAIANADQFAENVMAGRSKGNEPTLFNAKNPFVKAFTMFQLEVNNQYGYLFKDVPTDLKAETEHWKFNLTKGYATAFVGAHIYNALMEQISGSGAALDPIGIIKDLLRDLGLFDEEEEKEGAEVFTNFVDNVGEELPFVSTLFGGGRIPISSAVPYSGEGFQKGIENFAEDMSDLGDGGGKRFLNELSNPLLNVGLPVGGGQLKKSIQGLNMFKDTNIKRPVKGSYTDSGDLRFPVEDTFGNKVQAALFGQWANENARNYIENGRKPLSLEQAREYRDVELPIADYWNYRDGLKGLKTNAEKADYIDSLDITNEQKNLLMNNILDRKEDIDMSNYSDYSGWEEFDYASKNPEKYEFFKANGISYSDYKNADEDGKNAYNWAFENPEKYTLAKTVADDVVEYRSYISDLYDIRADKDANGKSISGTAKRKKLEYINNLNIDYEAKIVLFKSLYPTDDTYNTEIIEYINNRNDLTYDERITIFAELGFTVKNGYVYW